MHKKGISFIECVEEKKVSSFFPIQQCSVSSSTFSTWFRYMRTKTCECKYYLQNFDMFAEIDRRIVYHFCLKTLSISQLRFIRRMFHTKERRQKWKKKSSEKKQDCMKHWCLLFILVPLLFLLEMYERRNRRAESVRRKKYI